MDRNALVAFVLSFAVLSAWMAWEAKMHPAPKPGVVAEEPAAPAPPPAGGVVRSPEPVPAPTAAPAPSPAPPHVAPSATEPEQTVDVSTSLFHAVLTSRGAGVRRFELRTYFAPRSEGGGPVVLIDRAPDEAPAFATPLGELGMGELDTAVFRVADRSAEQVTFESTQSGVTVRKRFRFDDELYRFRLQLEIVNGSSVAISPEFGVRLPERNQPGSDFGALTLAALVEGAVQRTPMASFGRSGGLGALFSSGPPDPHRRFAGDVEWTGAYSHYFLTALLPDVARDARTDWFAVTPGEETLVSVSHPAVAIPPGSSVDREYTVYAGPKEPERLVAVGAQLERSIDLGYTWIAPLTRAFVWMLKACHSVIPNYGVAIIVLTVVVRLCTAPLAAKQMKSMRRMGQIQPELKKLQEKFKDDRQRQSQEMMKLYREAGVNPLGGCLPMVLQIPVFIGLYYALQSSIDLRQAPFMLWIDDLSRPETLFTLPVTGWPIRVLPILMTASMVIQQRMTPTTSMDPAQARTMMIMMPLMFFFMFYGFPSGLVLYWFVSNLLAVAQQLYLNRRLGPSPAAATAGGR